jgi:hypothetical protein
VHPEIATSPPDRRPAADPAPQADTVILKVVCEPMATPRSSGLTRPAKPLAEVVMLSSEAVVIGSWGGWGPASLKAGADPRG